MADNEKNPLDELLGELFPAGQAETDEREGAKDDSREIRMPNPEGGPDIVVSLSNAEIADAIKSGTLHDLAMRKLAEGCEQAGVEVLSMEVTDSGIVLRKGDVRLDLDPQEAVLLHQSLGKVITQQVRQARDRMFGDLFGPGGLFG